MYHYRRKTGIGKQKQKEIERKLIKSVLRAIHDRQALVGPGASQCLLALISTIIWDGNITFIYVTCICNIDGR